VEIYNYYVLVAIGGSMFKVGDNIAYPMHGAGTILGIEDQDVLGEVHKYYHVELPYSRMTVMIPVNNSDAVGVRGIISKDDIGKVFDVLEDVSGEMSSNWNRRFRENTEKLKTGDIYIVAGVVRDLVRNDRIKKLSTGEKKLLTNAKQILESELVYAGGYSIEEADMLVESHI
jgi:CarD family transcriptional regulator